MAEIENNIEEIKKEIVKKLKPLKPEKIILFGSWAYGNPTYESDLDICVIEKSYKNRYEEKAKIRKLLKNIKLPKDILVPFLDEYEFYKQEYCGCIYSLRDTNDWRKKNERPEIAIGEEFYSNKIS